MEYLKLNPAPDGKNSAGGRGGILKIKLTEPPLEGKANRGSDQTLKLCFPVPKSAVRFISGERGRNKLIRMEGISPAEAAGVFSELLPTTAVTLQR